MFESRGATRITIGTRTVGEGRTFVIADLGSNHAQDLQLALESIDAAADAGADAVKFQSLQMKDLYLDPAPDVRRLYSQIDLSEAWYAELQQRCADRGVVFFSSPTYLSSVDLLESLGVPLYKLASAQVATFPQIVSRVAATGKPVFLSTGLVTTSELEPCIRLLHEAGNPDFVVLHCNAIYPTPSSRVNLRQMEIYARTFSCLVGFSDHTDGTAVAVAAVARGAAVIEKHFTLSRTIRTPDAVVALEPHEFAEMTAGIRAVESALVSWPRLELEPEEAEFRESLRYRLVLVRDKDAGARFADGDFSYRRHPSGIDCREERHVIRHFSARTPLAAGTLLTWSVLAGS